MSLYYVFKSLRFIPLLSAEPPWDEGDEEDDELEEVLCSIASKESSERRRSGLLKKDESRPFKYAVSSYKSTNKYKFLFLFKHTKE